jgi:hypothetical protein
MAYAELGAIGLSLLCAGAFGTIAVPRRERYAGLVLVAFLLLLLLLALAMAFTK